VRRFLPLLAVCLTVLTLAAAPARAWSNKEHIQLTRLAVSRLLANPDTPPAMKEWLKKAAPGLLDLAGEKDYFMNARVGLAPRGADGMMFWAMMPDFVALTDREDRKVEPWGVHERLLHYIDLEFFMPDDKQRTYADDLSHKPKAADVPRDAKDPRYVRAGMLPFRVEESYQRLVKAIRAGRLVDAPGQFPRDEHATKWAGYLAHYLADNTQPQHATIDYKSETYFKGVRRPPNVHADIEYRFIDEDAEDYTAVRAELCELFFKKLDEVKDPVETTDLWQATLEVALTSYDALPLIGKAAAAAYKAEDGTIGPVKADVFMRTKGQYRGREMSVAEMKAEQTAWAVKRIERVLRQAWDEGTKKE